MSLAFHYSVMAAGKSLHLLGVRHNYLENGKAVLLFTSAIDDRSGVGSISSRLGVSAPAVALRASDDLFKITEVEHRRGSLSAVLIDEVQFLTKDHIIQAARVADDLGLPVMAYGLKNNVFGELFSDAISTLLAYADNIREVKQVCHCGCKATMILRFRPDGSVEKTGNVVETGGDNRYVSVCRRHWVAGDIGPTNRAKLNLVEAPPGARIEIPLSRH